jgi:hypothetical protein
MARMQRPGQLNPRRVKERLGRVARLLAMFGVGFGAFSAASCSDEPEPRVCTPLSEECPAEVPSYARDIAPLIERRCGSCHRDPENGRQTPWPFYDYQDVLDWDFTIMVSLDDCSMPPVNSNVPFPDEERQMLYAWLMCGAPNN